MSELHTDEVGAIEETIENTETGTGETGAELAPATGENQEEKTQVDAQEAANKAINKKHFQYKEEERKRLAAEKELEELRAKVSQQSASRPDIPPPPDPFSDNYAEEIKARDEAIRQAMKFDARQEAEQERLQHDEQKQQQAQMQKVEQMVSAYNQNATKLGLDVGEVERAGDTLVQYGVSQDVASFLLADEDGPLMTKYLAANPLELEQIQSMPPMQAAIALNDGIRQKAAGLRPKSSNTPEPPEILNGGGMPEDDGMPHIKGARFE